MQDNIKDRIIEIDLLRTIAITLMIIYHTAFDLWYFYQWDIDLGSTAWTAFRITTASLFLLISGISSRFSKHPFKRALVVLACAMLITGVTYVNDPSTFIYFGILHCIGIGMLLLIPLKRLKEMNILLGIILLFFPLFSFHFPLSTLHFVRATLDYYPLIPWFGIMLIGSGLGHYLYIRNTLHLPGAIPNILTWIGKHALIIYMIHQPILLVLLALLYAI